MTLTWSAPSTGTPNGGYVFSTTPADFPTNNTTNTTAQVTGLTNGTAYTFHVRAIDNSVYGPLASATATPRAIPPGAPTNLGATKGPGAGQYTLSWTPPTSTGSSPGGTPPTIDHYTVTVSPGGISQQTNASTTTYLASNLADNVTYTFAVTATNSRNVTGPAASVYAPLPSGATIGLQPTAGDANTDITAAGQLFLNNESITLYWDDPSHVAAAVVTDNNGAFTKVVKPFSGDKPKVHKLCASVPPTPCATFTLQAPPSPTPTPPSPQNASSPTASPTEIPRASAARSGGGNSGLDIITKPPFVFLPIIGILGLLGAIAFWLLSSSRRPVPPPSATVVHLATRPDYIPPFATPLPPPATEPAAVPEQPALAPPPPPPPAAAPPPVLPPQAVPPTPVEPPAPPSWPAAPDEPPDLPEPSD